MPKSKFIDLKAYCDISESLLSLVHDATSDLLALVNDLALLQLPRDLLPLLDSLLSDLQSSLDQRVNERVSLLLPVLSQRALSLQWLLLEIRKGLLAALVV